MSTFDHMNEDACLLVTLLSIVPSPGLEGPIIAAIVVPVVVVVLIIIVVPAVMVPRRKGTTNITEYIQM